MSGTYEFTYAWPQDRCRQTAMFLWWFNPTISVFLILPLYYFSLPILLYEAHRSLQGRLKEITGKEEITGTVKTDDHGPKTSTGDKKDSPVKIGTTGDGETGATGLGAGDTNTSDTDTVIVDAPSSDAQNTDKTTDHVSKPAPTKSAMTPEQIRLISHVFVQHTLLTFVIQPLLIFVGCLLTNNVAFCVDYNRQMPLFPRLWNMLWVLLPGYLGWGWSVVGSWGETATVVMGWDEGRKEGEISSVQMVLMFVTMPIPMLLMVSGYMVYNGLVSVVEGAMTRRTRGGNTHERLGGDMTKAGVGGHEQSKKDS